MGQVALVTGASRGIGKAIACSLARKGAALAVNFHTSRERAEEVVADICAQGGRAAAFQADVSRRDQAERLLEECCRVLGPVDILVNNARRLIKGKSFAEVEWSDYEAHIEVMLKGTFNCCKAVVPSMMERRRGRIINVLSTVIGEARARTSAYGTIKSALLFFSRNLAVELGEYGVTVNMVSPGLIRTEKPFLHSSAYQEEYIRQTPLGRLGSVEDVAEAVAYFASEEAAFVTGVNMAVAGGKVIF